MYTHFRGVVVTKMYVYSGNVWKFFVNKNMKHSNHETGRHKDYKIRISVLSCLMLSPSSTGFSAGTGPPWIHRTSAPRRSRRTSRNPKTDAWRTGGVPAHRTGPRVLEHTVLLWVPLVCGCFEFACAFFLGGSVFPFSCFVAFGCWPGTCPSRRGIDD